MSDGGSGLEDQSWDVAKAQLGGAWAWGRARERRMAEDGKDQGGRDEDRRRELEFWTRRGGGGEG
jgi:hypothetical protein